jgi:hypothetical protein
MKIVVPYNHDPADFDLIEIAVSQTRSEKEPLEGWIAAYRDTINGQRVVWARFDHEGIVWVRDRNGSRRVLPIA